MSLFKPTLSIEGFVALMALTFLLAVGAVVALLIVSWRGLRRVYRARAVAKELAAVEVPALPFLGSVSDRRRSDLVRPGLPAVRPGEPGHSSTARVLQFHEELAARGCYVNELSIQRRLN